MKNSHKLLIGVGAIAVVLCLVGVTCLYTRAPDFWGYGKLGVGEGTSNSPVFFVEVRGVGRLPTVAYMVRCPEQAAMPKNFLEVSRSAISHFEKRTRVMDRWRSGCMLLVGRSVGEMIPIPLDAATAKRLFSRPGTEFGDFTHCQEFWEEFVSPRILEFDSSQTPTHPTSP